MKTALRKNKIKNNNLYTISYNKAVIQKKKNKKTKK